MRWDPGHRAVFEGKACAHEAPVSVDKRLNTWTMWRYVRPLHLTTDDLAEVLRIQLEVRPRKFQPWIWYRAVEADWVNINSGVGYLWRKWIYFGRPTIESQFGIMAMVCGWRGMEVSPFSKFRRQRRMLKHRVGNVESAATQILNPRG